MLKRVKLVGIKEDLDQMAMFALANKNFIPSITIARLVLRDA